MKVMPNEAKKCHPMVSDKRIYPQIAVNKGVVKPANDKKVAE